MFFNLPVTLHVVDYMDFFSAFLSLHFFFYSPSKIFLLVLFPSYWHATMLHPQSFPPFSLYPDDLHYYAPITQTSWSSQYYPTSQASKTLAPNVCWTSQFQCLFCTCYFQGRVPTDDTTMPGRAPLRGASNLHLDFLISIYLTTDVSPNLFSDQLSFPTFRFLLPAQLAL